MWLNLDRRADQDSARSRVDLSVYGYCGSGEAGIGRPAPKFYNGTMRYVVTLEHVAGENGLQVGGKAATLARLVQAGMSVPLGFCIATVAYEEFICSNGLDDLISICLSRLERSEPLAKICTEIRRAILSADVPRVICQEIIQMLEFAEFNSTPLVVRSSAILEDLQQVSFAGQYESYLNISGVDQIIGKVRECWASLWSERAVIYRRRHRLDPQLDKMAVIVQRMIWPDVSGVTMTGNPITGSTAEVIITASFGLAESIVSGLVSPDEYHVDKERKEIVSKHIADKKIESVAASGGQILRRALPAGRRREQSLSEPQILKLAEIAIRIETLLGSFQEIEWSLENDSVFILQARPLIS